jgi:hypothetical protein
MGPHHVNPVQWHQTVGVARQACARVFRDGGTPADALAAFGIDGDERAFADLDTDWGKAVEAIAQVLCAAPAKRAA